MNEASVTTINEQAAEEYYRKGVSVEKAGLYERAVDFYELALEENPDHESACFRLAVLYDRHSEDAKAIELYERICTSPPVHLNALLNLAILYEDNNHYEEAHRCLDTILRTDPNHERARLYMKDVESARMTDWCDDTNPDRDRPNALLTTPITDFELSIRCRHGLEKANLKTLGDLVSISEQALLGIRNFGPTSLEEIKVLLSSKRLSLGQALEGRDPRLGHRDLGPTSNPAPELLGKSIGDLDWSIRSRKALQRLNINTLEDLVRRTEAELLGCKNFGATSLNEVKQQLANFGLSLRTLDD